MPPHDTAPSARASPPPFGLSPTAGKAFVFIYGLVSISFLGLLAILDGYIFRRPSLTWWRQVQAARDAVWDLSARPFPGFAHHFHALGPSRKIHYLANSSAASGKQLNLVILVHGWPDSSLLWRQVVTSLPAAATNSAKIIALDLPGSGGSENASPNYSPEGMLEALAAFVLAMRDQYLADGGKVTIVGHDWGCLLSFRLAAEAPQLADRFILINGGIGPHIRSNMQRRVQTATRLGKHWLAAPTRWSLLRSAYTTVLPVLRQLRSSTYIATFNLPAPVVRVFGRLGHEWFLRFACSLASGAHNATHTATSAAHVANAMGPSAHACNSATAAGDTYGSDVATRAVRGRFLERVKIYREGVLFKPWNKSLELITALHQLPHQASIGSGAGLLDSGPPGACGAPATVVFGCQDTALQKEIFLEGIAEYLPVKGSHVVELKQVAHWVPADARGANVVAQILAWSVHGEDAPLNEVLGGEAGVEVKHAA